MWTLLLSAFDLNLKQLKVWVALGVIAIQGARSMLITACRKYTCFSVTHSTHLVHAAPHKGHDGVHKPSPHTHDSLAPISPWPLLSEG